MEHFLIFNTCANSNELFRAIQGELGQIGHHYGMQVVMVVEKEDTVLVSGEGVVVVVVVLDMEYVLE
jgi:hypothetical protein